MTAHPPRWFGPPPPGTPTLDELISAAGDADEHYEALGAHLKPYAALAPSGRLLFVLPRSKP